MLEIINVIVFVCVLMKSRWAASRNFRGRFLKIKSPHLQRRVVSAKSAEDGGQRTEDGGQRTEDGGAPCRSTARTGPHSLFGGVSSPLLSSPLLRSPPLPLFPSHLPPSLSPRGGRSSRLVLRERERGREGRERESPLGRVTKRFPQRGSGEPRARESSEGKQRCSGHHRAPDASRTAGLREKRRESEQKEEERGDRWWWHLIWVIADLSVLPDSFNCGSQSAPGETFLTAPHSSQLSAGDFKRAS